MAQEYGFFLLQWVTVLVGLALVVGIIIGGIQRARMQGEPEGKLIIKDLSARLRRRRQQIERALLPDRKALRSWRKQEKQREKDVKAKQSDAQARAWVIDYKGDVQASDTAQLTEVVSALLEVAKPGDTVVLRLESPGGVVPGYGLAASQLLRLKDHGLQLWTTVDKVAASGGYMMACVADRIFAAPFAVVGSIGVVAQLPNFNRLLKKNDIDVELHTAGAHKRSLTVFGENTKAGREHFKQQLNAIHDLFKQHVARARPKLDIDQVADGDYWFGEHALAHGLVDDIRTSDEVLRDLAKTHRVLQLNFVTPKSLQTRFAQGTADAVMHLFDRFQTRFKGLG
jgi:serine protease SohB